MTRKIQRRLARHKNEAPECASFNLRRADRLLTQFYDDGLREVGMRVTQYTLLSVLNALGEMSTGELAERMGADRTTLTRNLGPVRKRGWVEIRRGEDRRVRIVSLTPEGREALAEAIPLWREMQKQVRRRLGGDRLEGLLADLNALVETLR